MGTNYYLKKKRVFKPEEVMTLTNGYVFKNTYYASVRELEFESCVHIGKMSSGWCFLMHGYGEFNCLEDFNKLIEIGYTLYDECGEEHNFDEFVEQLKARRDMVTTSGKDTGYAAIDKRYGLLRHNDATHMEEPYDIIYRDASEDVW